MEARLAHSLSLTGGPGESCHRREGWGTIHLARGSHGVTWVQLAGTPSGVSVVDKAQFAVNTIKVITALNDISDLLKVTPHARASRLHCQSTRERTGRRHVPVPGCTCPRMQYKGMD